jgi:HAD superfamily hydrolase (TIGR01484 family)
MAALAPPRSNGPRPLSEAALGQVRVVLTDVDGTLTTEGRLQSETLRAIEGLAARGVDVVLVSGRPSGWGECWSRQLPISGAIVENGGLYFARRGARLVKVYAQPAAVRSRSRIRLVQEVRRILEAVPGVRLSMDSASTEVDLAVDYAEEARAGLEAGRAVEALARERGLRAVRSSVHVNCWVGRFDKRTMAQRFLARELGFRFAPGAAPAAAQRSVAFVGDSFNDEPLFAWLPLSVGVANVRDVLAELAHPPRFVTRSRGGLGFAELAAAILCSKERA